MNSQYIFYRKVLNIYTKPLKPKTYPTPIIKVTWNKVDLFKYQMISTTNNN